MSRTEEGQLSKRLGMIIRKERWIRGRKDSSHLSSGIVLKNINKGSHPNVNIKWQIP
jgi:hypothetical protein